MGKVRASSVGYSNSRPLRPPRLADTCRRAPVFRSAGAFRCAAGRGQLGTSFVAYSITVRRSPSLRTLLAGEPRRYRCRRGFSVAPLSVGSLAQVRAHICITVRSAQPTRRSRKRTGVGASIANGRPEVMSGRPFVTPGPREGHAGARSPSRAAALSVRPFAGRSHATFVYVDGSLVPDPPHSLPCT